MENNTNCNLKNINELLKIETILLNLSNKMMKAELKEDKEELKRLNDYYELSLLVEQKNFIELELNHDTFLEIIKYLKEKNNIHNNRLQSIFYEQPHFQSLRIIYKLMTMVMNFDNINEERLMTFPIEQKEILNSFFKCENAEIFVDKELYGSILLEQQLARTCLYNLERHVKENKELMEIKHNLSYVYNYQIYEDKMTIIESDKYLKFYKTDIITYSNVAHSYLKPMAISLLTCNIEDKSLKNISKIKKNILLESIIFLLDDMAVRELKDIAIANNDEISLNIIKNASIEKYELDNFKRR